MMSSSEVREIRDASNELHDGLTITAERFDRIESDGVSLQCINSSDFMVGKQTNFNGPVTIINYGDGDELDNRYNHNAKATEIVIKDRIMAPGVTASLENFVKKKAGEEEFKLFQLSNNKKDHQPCPQSVCKMTFLKIPVFVWSILLFIVTAGFITLGIELSEDTTPEDAETFLGGTRNYTLYSRKHWGAAEEMSSVALNPPVPYLIISSTNGEPCEGLKQCGKILREQQKLQKKKSQADIYPNFLVSGDGAIYEGRGWKKRNAFHGFANSRSLEISFIGDFAVYEKPTKNQTEAARAFIAYALREGMLQKDYRLCPATARGILLVEENPTMGHNLYEVVKNWGNFDPDPYQQFSPGQAEEKSR